MLEIASAYKVLYHRKKLEAYLQNQQIMPASLELDITTNCNKKCPHCPSTTGLYSHNLDLKFIERLFARLEGETRGLLLSGGEPTMSPIFPEVLKLARDYGFIDIAIVTNGSLLDKEQVAEALCAYASTIRVSIYDWTGTGNSDLKTTLRKIQNLKTRIDSISSKLEIGVSALTSKENANAIQFLAHEVDGAGANWIYFHPKCIRWDTGAPERVNQLGVLEKIREYQDEFSNEFKIFTFPERYVEDKIEFSGYHAAHFLLVVGADGMNYLGAEVKYHPKHIITDIKDNMNTNFLWNRERLNHINSVKSTTYPALQSRHRGVLYNHVIQTLLNKNEQTIDKINPKSDSTYLYPHIL
jgi:sulfatase maturation enzyme AslB (radical SAM superfamily)